MLENDIYDLQIKISYMESYVKDLNSVIIEQDKSNSLLSREIKLLKNKVDQLEERIQNKGGEFQADEAPPHY